MTSRNGKLEGKKCFKCGVPGHTMKDCRSKKGFQKVNTLSQYHSVLSVDEVGHASLLGVEGKLDDKKVKFYFDTGATVSFVSSRTAERLELDVLPSDVMVKVANNSITNVKGKTKALNVDISGHTCMLEFVVMDHDDHEALLGLDWFGLCGASITPGERVLKFPQKKVFLIQRESEEEGMDVLTEIEQDDIMLAETNGPLAVGELSLVTTDKENPLVFKKARYEEEEDLDFPLDEFPLKRREKPKPVEQLSEKDIERFNSSIIFMMQLFAYTMADLKCAKLGPMRIRIIDSPPISMPRFRRPQAEQERLQEEVDKLLECGIVEKSKSSWNFNVFMVPKKGLDIWRMVTDFRPLNAITITEHWPLPRIEDIFDRLAGSMWFSTLDLASGFYQIPLDAASRALTAFSTWKGRYQFTRMVMGLKNSPVEFTRLMAEVLGDLPFVEVYIDDVIIHSRTLALHFEHIVIVAKRLKEYSLSVKPTKCQWVAKKIKILGHTIEQGRVEMDMDKLKVIKERPRPHNKKDVQTFLGMTGYYRRFIAWYSEIALPLFALLKDGVKFTWTEECERAYRKLIEALINFPILRLPDWTKMFILHTDCSNYCMGATLAQRDDNGDEYAVAYWSKGLKGAELNYGITEKECKAAVEAVKHFRVYLLGRPFKLVVDHSALTWLMSLREPTGRLARWILYFQQYEFTIEYRKGSKHSNADALSRPPIQSNVLRTVQAIEEANETEEGAKSIDPYEDSALLHFLEFGKHLAGLSRKAIRRVLLASSHYMMHNVDNKQALFYRRNEQDGYVPVPRPEQRNDLIGRYHSLGHFQSQTTYNTMRESYFWPKMLADVENF